MDAPPLVPADWDRFLNKIGADLGELLDRATEREAVRTVEAAPAFTLPLSECMQRIHDGMDERIGRLEIHLKELDQHLSQAEGEAHQLQAGGRQLRDRHAKTLATMQPEPETPDAQ